MLPRVFVSYSPDSDEHRARITELVARLRGEGLTVVYDGDIAKVGGPEEGWARWCERQIVECDCVLACCSVLFHKRFDDAQNTEGGRGVAWEAHFIREYLYNNPNTNKKVRPLVFEEGDRRHIPNALASFSYFLPSQKRSYADLLGWLKARTAPPTTAIAVVTPVAAIDWPPPADDFQRGLADRCGEFDRLRRMLAGRSEHRILLVQGPSGSGKTALVHECIAYARHQRVPCSHIDLKGALQLEEVFETLVMDLGEAVLQRACSRQPSARTHAVVSDLQQLRRPLFLAFDTYEDASQTSQSWIEMLLSRVDRCPALVVSVAGRKIPEHSGRTWAPLAHVVALPPIQETDDWIDFAHRRYGRTGVKRDHVEAFTLALKGDPGEVSTMIDALVRGMPAT
jgi:hypothetical protein